MTRKSTQSTRGGQRRARREPARPRSLTFGRAGCRNFPRHPCAGDGVSTSQPPPLFLVTVGVRGGCNYTCSYCVARNQIEKTSVHSVDRLTALLERLPQPLVIELECGGAEPTLHPQIRELLEACVQHGIASIPTNNSLPPSQWMPRTRPRRIHLRASLHPESEADLDGFLRRLLQARRLGAEVEVGFVAHPTRASKSSDYATYFAAHEI